MTQESTPPASQSDEALVEELARLIAAELGDDYNNAFVSKVGWVAARGESGGRYRDVNEPFKGDYDAAARAILPIIDRERATARREGIEEAARYIDDHLDMWGPRDVGAEIRALGEKP